MMILGALLLLKYLTQHHPICLLDVLGISNLRVCAGIHSCHRFLWHGFCRIARIFTPQQGADENQEVFISLGRGFWRRIQAILTWWGVSVAL